MHPSRKVVRIGVAQACWFFLLASLALQTRLVDGSARFVGMVKLDSDVRDLQWVGASDQVVLAITAAGHLWRSHDGGASWEDQTASGLLEGALDEPPSYGTYVPMPGVAAMILNPLAESKILLRGSGEQHWISTDYGETYKQVKGPAGHIGLMTIRPHPTEADWILLTARRWACWTPSEAARCADDLFVTKDFGMMWTNLTKASQGRIISFVDFDWGWSKGAQHSSQYSKETILASVYENRADVEAHLRASGASPVQQGWDRYVDFVQSHDFFSSPHVKAVPCGNQFEIVNTVIFLAVAAHCEDRSAAPSGGGHTGVRLFLSRDYGGTFTQACIPDALSERGYSVADVTDDAVYLNVEYWQGAPTAGTQLGTTYVSDANLTLFSVALRRTARSPASAVDFTRIQGLPGIYVANQVTSDGGEAVPGGGNRHKLGGGEDPRFAGPGSRTGANLVTQISFNGGVDWEPIAPPSRDSQGQPIACKWGECHLHLHGPTSWEGRGSIPGFAFAYSHKSAPGVVMSTGNVGRYLYQDGEVNTYLSPDGGQSWREVAKGAYIYEFGDYGGIIVMAKHYLQGPTTEIMYSLDEGVTWGRAKFAEEPVDVYNIRVEPDNAGRKFILQGLTAPPGGTAGGREGVLIPVDFSQDASYKPCDASAYEDWSPSVKRCLLGQNVTITRQKAAAVCWNEKGYTRPPMTSRPCQCTDLDFECDFGAERLHPGGKCQKFENLPVEACPVLFKGKYDFGKTHQRLIAGDKCANPHLESGVYKEWYEGEDGGMSLGGTVVVVVFGVMLVGCSVFAYMVQKGRVPDSWLQHVPFLSRYRYQNLRGNFQSLTDDFSLVMGEDDENDGQ